MQSNLNRFLALSPTMLSIQQQTNDVIFDKLVPLFAGIREDGAKAVTKQKAFSKQVREAVKQAFNMDVTLHIENKNKDAAHVIIPQLDKNHPLLNRKTRPHINNRQLREQLEKDLSLSWASVDPTTGRVDGFLATLPVNITIGVDYIVDGSILTVEEAVAVFLHELGHAWTYFYMLGGTLRTNVVIDAAMRDYKFGENPKEDAERIMVIEQAMHVKLPNSKSNAAKGNNVVAISILNKQIEMQRSEYGTTGFDESGAEAIADQFTARCGAGVHIVTGLDKLQKRNGLIRAGSVILDLLSALATIKLFGAPLLIAVFMTDPTKGSYDDPYKRAKRVREQVVASLRDKSLPSSVRRQKLTELDTIDQVMETVKENESLFDFIWRRVIEGGNSRVKDKINQERLESLINNDLYVLDSVLTLNQTK